MSGEYGKAVIEDGRLKLWLLDCSERKICFESERDFYEAKPSVYEYLPDEKESAHKGVIQAFSDAILKGTPPVAWGEEGINELMISNAAYLSQWKNNTPVNLPIDADEFERMLDKMAQSSESARESAKPAEKAEKQISHVGYQSRWSVNW